jgi:hypothetical protein
MPNRQKHCRGNVTAAVKNNFGNTMPVTDVAHLFFDSRMCLYYRSGTEQEK